MIFTLSPTLVYFGFGYLSSSSHFPAGHHDDCLIYEIGVAASFDEWRHKNRRKGSLKRCWIIKDQLKMRLNRKTWHKIDFSVRHPNMHMDNHHISLFRVGGCLIFFEFLDSLVYFLFQSDVVMYSHRSLLEEYMQIPLFWSLQVENQDGK